MVLFSMLSTGCSLGGQYIAPFLMPLFNIPGLISWLILCIICVVIEPNMINSQDNKKDTGRTAGITFLFYYVISASILFVMFGKICNVVSEPTVQFVSNFV